LTDVIDDRSVAFHKERLCAEALVTQRAYSVKEKAFRLAEPDREYGSGAAANLHREQYRAKL
jgi:hypothetical protein